MPMPLSVFIRASLCCLLPFHLVVCHCFRVMSLVRILPEQSLINYGYDIEVSVV